MKIPNTTWKIRKGKDWFEESASDYFSGKRSLVVSLPGAFTPIWSEMQLPGLEALYDDYKEKGDHSEATTNESKATCCDFIWKDTVTVCTLIAPRRGKSAREGRSLL